LIVLGIVAVVVQCIGLYGPPGPPAAPGLPVDKVEHLLGFAVPVGLFVAARVNPWWVLGLAVGQAVTSEVVQGLLLPDRSGDPLDLLADLVGIALGWAVPTVLVRRRGRPAPTR